MNSTSELSRVCHPERTREGSGLCAPGKILRGVPLRMTIFLALTQSGCLVGPDYKRPAPTTMPVAWSTQPPPSFATTQPTTQSIATASPVQIVSWWQTFNDPELDSLVNRAFES